MAVVGRETGEENEANGPEHDGDGDGDGGHNPGVDDGVNLGDTGGGGFGKSGAPVPECDDVGLLSALDDAGTVDPCFDGSTTCRVVSLWLRRGLGGQRGEDLTFVSKVQGEENRTAGRSHSIHGGSNVLYPPSSTHAGSKMRHANEKELDSC